VSAADTARYEQLAKMIERELELVSAGRLDEFDAAVRARGELLASLPAPAPEAAAPAIARACALHSRVMIEALRVRDGLQRSRASLRRARRVTKGYSGPLRERYSTSA
jgi:hypothetical protein